MSGAFKRAERRQARIKMAITGPSGSGKTYSALLVAKGLARRADGSLGKIAVADTENDSAALYADSEGMPEFDSLSITPPFHTNKFVAAIREAVKGGYDVLVLDSVSHQWSGEGGIMDRMDKEKMAKPSANSYTMWAKFTPEHEAFKQAIVQAPIHIIATMRSKQDYVLEQGQNGKSTPKKVGMAPVQRDQFEYEFTTVLDLSMEHYATASKDRTSLFDGKHFVPNEETGNQIRAWLSTAKAAEAVTPPAASTAPQVTAQQRDQLIARIKERGWSNEQALEYMRKHFGRDKILDLTPGQYDEMFRYLAPQREPGDDTEAEQQPLQWDEGGVT